MLKYLTIVTALIDPAFHLGYKDLEFYSCPSSGVVVDYRPAYKSPTIELEDAPENVAKRSSALCEYVYTVEFRCSGQKLVRAKICSGFLKAK